MNAFQLIDSINFLSQREWEWKNLLNGDREKKFFIQYEAN